MLSDSSKLAAVDRPVVEQGPRWSWHPVQVVSLTVLLFVLSQLLSFVIAYGTLRLFAITTGASGDQVDSWYNSNIAQFVTIGIAELAAAAGVIGLYRRHRLSLADLGLGRWPRRSDPVKTLTAFMVYTAISIGGSLIIKLFLPEVSKGQQDIGFSNATSPSALAMVFIALVVFAPIGEEILFRGFLFGGLRRRLKWLPAALVTSLLFGAAHLAGSDQGFAAPLWSAGYDTLVLSFVLCYLREKTDSLWAGIFLHMLKNGLAFILLFVFHITT